MSGFRTVHVRTLGSNSFSFEVQLQAQLQFQKFGVEFNLKFEPGAPLRGGVRGGLFELRFNPTCGGPASAT